MENWSKHWWCVRRHTIAEIFISILPDNNDREWWLKCFTDFSKISSAELATSRHRAIMFLSDGTPSDAPQKILDLIYNRNRAMHNSVVILCYALGEGTFGRFVEKMSKQQHVPSRVTTCNHQVRTTPWKWLRPQCIGSLFWSFMLIYIYVYHKILTPLLKL